MANTNEKLREQLKAANAKNLTLQEKMAELEKKASYITPEMEDLIELYRMTEKYGDMCFNIVKKSMSKMSLYVNDDLELENHIYEAYRNKFGKLINEFEAIIERDLSGRLLDNISDFFGNQKEA